MTLVPLETSLNIFKYDMCVNLHSQIWCLWSGDRNVDADDDDVRNTGPYPDHEGPGQRERQHRVHAEREEEEERNLRRKKHAAV